MGKTKYQVSWQTEFPWLSRGASDPYYAHCAVCLNSFKIDNQGIGQVKSHAKCHETNSKKDALQSFLAQRSIVVGDGNLDLTKKNRCVLSAQEDVTKVEVLDALYFVRANHSFASTIGNAGKYRLIFGERNPVASAYWMCEIKVAYVIKFSIAQYVRRKLIKVLQILHSHFSLIRLPIVK